MRARGRRGDEASAKADPPIGPAQAPQPEPPLAVPQGFPPEKEPALRDKVKAGGPTARRYLETNGALLNVLRAMADNDRAIAELTQKRQHLADEVGRLHGRLEALAEVLVDDGEGPGG